MDIYVGLGDIFGVRKAAIVHDVIEALVVHVAEDVVERPVLQYEPDDIVNLFSQVGD